MHQIAVKKQNYLSHSTFPILKIFYYIQFHHYNFDDHYYIILNLNINNYGRHSEWLEGTLKFKNKKNICSHAAIQAIAITSKKIIKCK